MSTRLPASPPERFDAIDALRGFALLWMTLYHFFFDLDNFRYLRLDFYNDPLWTWQRTLILSLFLWCAGCGQALAVVRGQSWARFWRRWIWIAVCALLVTAGSMAMFPRSYIYFGVLHGMAVMLVLVRLMAGAGAWLFPVGLLALVLPLAWGALPVASEWSDWMNAPALNWLGLITRKPVTEDYVPLLPWFGVMCWGAASGHWWVRRQSASTRWRSNGALAWLPWLGRRSLWYYMLHQPLMIAGLWLFGAATA